jgi:hypothetical protein
LAARPSTTAALPFLSDRDQIGNRTTLDVAPAALGHLRALRVAGASPLSAARCELLHRASPGVYIERYMEILTTRTPYFLEGGAAYSEESVLIRKYISGYSKIILKVVDNVIVAPLSKLEYVSVSITDSTVSQQVGFCEG